MYKRFRKFPKNDVILLHDNVHMLPHIFDTFQYLLVRRKMEVLQ